MTGLHNTRVEHFRDLALNFIFDGRWISVGSNIDWSSTWN